MWKGLKSRKAGDDNDILGSDLAAIKLRKEREREGGGGLGVVGVLHLRIMCMVLLTK